MNRRVGEALADELGEVGLVLGDGAEVHQHLRGRRTGVYSSLPDRNMTAA